LKPRAFKTLLFGTAEAVPFPVRVKSEVNIKINVKGVGQECPTHMGRVKITNPRVRDGNALTGHC